MAHSARGQLVGSGWWQETPIKYSRYMQYAGDGCARNRFMLDMTPGMAGLWLETPIKSSRYTLFAVGERVKDVHSTGFWQQAYTTGFWQ